MKQQLSPVVVAIVIVVVVAIAGAFVWKGTSGRSGKDVNAIINASVAGGGVGTKTGPPPGVDPTKGPAGMPNMGGAGGGAPMVGGLAGGPGAPRTGAPMPNGPR